MHHDIYSLILCNLNFQFPISSSSLSITSGHAVTVAEVK